MFRALFPVFLQVLGIGVIISEFFIPSGGILSALSTGLLAYSIYLVFTTISHAAGYFFIVADVIVVPIVVIIGVKVVLKTRVSLKTELSSKDGVVSQSAELAELVGKQGVAVSNLRPSGIALIEGRRVDVVTGGEYILKNTPVEVVHATANQVVVRSKMI